MTYRLTKTWPDQYMQKLANWTCELMNVVGPTARLIGCSSEAVIAQAALETGWGASVVGKHNLFGIKADASWSGQKVLVHTREVINGQSVMIDDWFRDYPSFEGSIADHFAFLKKNTRYARVFDPNDSLSDEQYFVELQKAGYATDPNYARSLMNMLGSVKMFTAHMVDDAVPAAIAPSSPPAGYVQTETGNIVAADMSKSTIIKGANQGTVAAAAGTVASVGVAASSFAGLDWRVIAALGGVAALLGMLGIVYLLLIRNKRIEMHNQGVV